MFLRSQLLSAVAGLALCSAFHPAHGQTGPAPPPSQPSTTEPPADRSARELKEEEHQRLLGVVPAFSAVMDGNAAPLSPRQKFHLFITDAIDPFDFAAAGADAALEQHANEFPEYGPGWSGYAKRFGDSFTDEFDGSLWASAILPSVLHQDPRYFRLGRGSFKRRLGYSALSAVRCKGDNGRWQPNYSNVAGNLIGGAISNAYYPASNRGLGLTFDRGLTDAAENSLANLGIEFYPDIIAALKRTFHRSKDR